MNSPFWSLVMRNFLEFFSMVPCAVLCFLPVQDRLRQKPLNIFLTGIPLSLLWAFAGGLVCADFGIARDFWVLPSFILFAVFFHRVCDLALWKPFSILTAVCAVFSCITNLTLVADALIDRTNTSGLFTLPGAGIHLLLSVLIVAIVWYPATHAAKWLVDDIEMARPKGLLIPFDKFVILDILPPEQYKNVLTKMRQYVEHGKEPEGLEPIEQVAFESLRSFMDENIKTYQRSILAHREAGRKGGRPKKTDENQKVFDDNQTEPIGFFEKPNETKRPLKYKVQSTTDTKVSDSSSAEALSPTPKSRFSPPDVETVKSYFAEKGGTEGQAIRFHAYYESNGWKVGRNPMKNWKAAASGWISRDSEQQPNKPAPGNTSRSAADVYADIFKGVI